MKKNVSLLAAGIMVSLSVISGCSAPAAVSQAEAAVVSTAAAEPETGEPAGEEMAEGTVSPDTDDNKPDENPEGENLREEKAAPVRIWGVITETGEDSIIVDNQSEVSSPGEIVLMIDPDSTYVLDGVNGFPVSLDEVQTGSFYAYLGPAMTMSLPPQSVPYAVIVNIPEDAAAPLYVIAAGAVEETDGDGRQTLAANDGTGYPIAEGVRIQPFRTKNIVRTEDIRKGSECLLWLDTEGTVERIVLLSE